MKRSKKAMVSTPRIFGSWMYQNVDQAEAPSILAAW